MQRPLTPSEAKVYALATFDWRPIPHRIGLDAFSRLVNDGFVQRRVHATPEEKGRLAVDQWRKAPKE